MQHCRDWKACDARREERARANQALRTSATPAISVALEVLPPTLPTPDMPKKARVYAKIRGRQYFLKLVRAHTSRHDGSIIWPEHLEWVGEEKDSTVFDGKEATMLAINWGAKVKNL